MSLLYRFYERKSKKEYLINSSKDDVNSNLSVLLKKKGKYMLLTPYENLYYGYVTKNKFQINTNYFLTKSTHQNICVEGEISSIDTGHCLVKVQFTIQDFLKKYSVVLVGSLALFSYGVFHNNIAVILFSFMFYFFADFIFLLVSLSGLSKSRELFERVTGFQRNE